VLSEQGRAPSQVAGGRERGGGRASGAAAGVSSAALFASYHASIRRYILSMVHDPVEADDLTQDVFLQVHRNLGSLRDPDAVVSWLYRIATHVSYDRFRKSSRQPRTEPLQAGDSVGANSRGDIADQLRLDLVLEQADMSACVRSYIEELSTDYQQVIFLHDLEELSNPEIARMLGVSLDAVKIRLHRARRKLQDALSRHCDLSLDEQGVLVCEPGAAASAT
jgi:RNA polymerase sigma-70 factor (ECF subfamily)